MFGQYAKQYDIYRPTYSKYAIQTIIQMTKNAMQPTNDLKMIDLAAGTGIASRIYAQYPEVKSVLCVDHDERMLQECDLIATKWLRMSSKNWD